MYGNIITSVYISKVMKLLFKDFLQRGFLYFYGFEGPKSSSCLEFHISQDFSAWN